MGCRLLACWLCTFLLPSVLVGETLIGTGKLKALPLDPAADMVAGIDRFLLRKIDQADSNRKKYWNDLESVEANRQFLLTRLGLEPNRHPSDEEFIFEHPPISRDGDQTVFRVRWPVLSHPAPQTSAVASLWGEGLWLGTHEHRPLAILIPDADAAPEQFVFGDRFPERKRFVMQLATKMNVLIVSTTSRRIHQHGGAKLTRREYLHRSAFELGRTLTGYEVQMVQAAIDRFPTAKAVTVCGFGEGAMVALMAGAVDPRIELTMVGNYFERRDSIWKQPLSRQVFGLLTRFSDAHIAALIAPRGFIEFSDEQINVELSGGGGAPATWSSPSREASSKEFARFQTLTKLLHPGYRSGYSVTGGLDATWPAIASVLDIELPVRWELRSPSWSIDEQAIQAASTRRAERQFDMIDAHNQAILAESDYERSQFMNLGHSRSHSNNESNQLDTSSASAYRESVERFRTHFREETIGWFDEELLPPNARSIPTHRGEKWQGHGVTMDVFPDVFAYGELLLPSDIKPDEQRPVVVCQHGLEGRPEDTILDNHRAYHDFAAKLAEEGFIVFAPQNPYIGKDAFRTLQRKSYPIGKTLFSIIGAQHQQILNWLKSIQAVDPDRIAFYGLSYGGKSAMRLPALLPEYCLSICSADFNDWVWKNASSRARYSYVGTGEYEIFEFGLGKTFNYAEMAALIAPRPFMVERGHFDGVGPDDRVAKEFAKVRHLYQARLKMTGQCEIEWFDGPHTINGQGTFDFLRRHLDWPREK